MSLDAEQPGAPESEAPELIAEVDTDLPDGEELVLDEPTEPEDEEVEYEGERFKVPSKLKDALLRQADYTRKTQEVAETRREVEAKAEMVERQAKAHQEDLKEVAHLVNIDQRLQQFAQVNWQALNQQDPQQAQALHIEFTQLQSQRGQLVSHLTQKQQQRQWETQQNFAKQHHEAEAFIKREIKDWSPEKDRALEAYALKEGIDTKSLSQLVLKSPAVLKLVDKAARYDQLVKAQAKKPTPESQAKPVTRISGAKAAATIDPDKMSNEQWLKWRNADLRKKT